MFASFSLAFWICIYMFVLGEHTVQPDFILYETCIFVLAGLVVDKLLNRPMKPAVLFVLDYIGYGAFVVLESYFFKTPITIQELALLWCCYSVGSLFSKGKLFTR